MCRLQIGSTALFIDGSRRVRRDAGRGVHGSGRRRRAGSSAACEGGRAMWEATCCYTGRFPSRLLISVMETVNYPTRGLSDAESRAAPCMSPDN